MPQVRPYRDHDIYTAPCVTCGVDVESDTFPVPERCAKCSPKPEPPPVRCPTCGGMPCPYGHMERYQNVKARLD